MAVLKWVDKNNFEFDGKTYTSVSDILPHQLVLRFRKNKVLIPKGNNEWDVFEGVNGDLEWVDETHYKVNGTSYTTTSAILSHQLVLLFSLQMTLIANGKNKWKVHSASSKGDTILISGVDVSKPLVKWDVNLIEQFIDDKKLIISSGLTDFFDLVDQWWDTSYRNIDTYKWIINNYFWDNLDKFNITIWFGDARTAYNTRVNGKQTFDGALLGRAPDANGIIFQTKFWDFNNNRFAQFPRDNNSANYFYMLRFYKFNKKTMLIKGYHDRIRNRAKPKENNAANAIKGFIVELK